MLAQSQINDSEQFKIYNLFKLVNPKLRYIHMQSKTLKLELFLISITLIGLTLIGNAVR